MGQLRQARTVISIQILNSLVSGILSVALPLMMKERNIDIVTIGFVFAAMPMIFQIGRMFFATISDFWGRKQFFAANGFLAVISSLIYYLARTPLEFLFGKVAEGIKSGSLWAVNRASLLETNEKKWRILVHLRTVVYVSYSAGTLLAGFFIVWFFFEGTLLLCAIVGGLVVPASLLLTNRRKKGFTMAGVLKLLDVRRKKKGFRIFLVLFFVMGLSFGFRSGFVFPLFLDINGFDADVIGVLLGLQVLIAGVFSYLFAKRVEIRRLVLVSGLLYTIMLALLGLSASFLAGALVVVYGVVEGLLSIGQEGIVTRITSDESYGTDIGLLMMGLHSGNTLSLAASGLLISNWGFAAPLLLSAFIYIPFYLGSYFVLGR